MAAAAFLAVLALILSTLSPPGLATAAKTTPTKPGATTTTTTTQPPVRNVATPTELHACLKTVEVSVPISTKSAVQSTATKTKTHKVKELAFSRRCKILVMGDSLGADLGWGLAREFVGNPKIDLIQKGKSDTSLTNLGYYNWPKNIKYFLQYFKPQLLVVFIGGNDERNLYVHGKLDDFPDADWRAAYAARVRLVVDEARKDHVQVLWVGMPIMGVNGYRQGMQVINSVFKTVAASTPGDTFLPTWDELAGPGGVYEATLRVNGQEQSLRSSDGIHFSYVGENVLATYIINEIKRLYLLPVHADFPEVIDR